MTHGSPWRNRMDGPSALTLELTGSKSDAAIAAGLCCVLLVCTTALGVAGALRSAEHLLAAVALAVLSLATSWYLARRSEVLPLHAALRWDGQGWLWSCGHDDASCSVRWMMDLQYGMLLQVQLPGGTRHWLWLWRKAHAKNWFALRRALIFSARTAHDHAKSGLSWPGV